MHKNVKDSACDSGDILADRQTHTQICSSQYFTAAPVSEVLIIIIVIIQREFLTCRNIGCHYKGAHAEE